MVTTTQFNGTGYRTGLRQNTLKAPIPCRGVGLHSGAIVSMLLRPAEAGAAGLDTLCPAHVPEVWVSVKRDLS